MKNRIPAINHLPGYTGSDYTTTVVRTWLHSCLTSHIRCRQRGAHPAPFPTRILDLRSGEVRLREGLTPTSVGSTNAAYACLSYCWGDDPRSITQTTRATLPTFCSSIPSASLTRTFREAVDCCRRLGIEFLWIDSLCIVQDDPGDWAAESQRMGDVYENAVLVIAAAASTASRRPQQSDSEIDRPAREAEDGWSGRRLYSRTRSCHLSKKLRYDFCTRRATPTYPNSSAHRIGPKSGNWSLLDRAWVFQELRLARRVLIFGDEEVMWECDGCFITESEMTSLPSAISTIENSSAAILLERGEVTVEDVVGEVEMEVKGERLWQPSFSGGMLSEEMIKIFKKNFEKSKGKSLSVYDKDYFHGCHDDRSRAWWRTVENYSKLDVTRQEDRLPAMAAMAQRMQELRGGDRYLAGLWEKTLLRDVLWVRRDERCRRPRKWRAPSWSWASVEGGVVHRNFEPLDELIEVTDIEHETEGQTHLGLVKRASISFLAPLMLCDIHGIWPMFSISSRLKRTFVLLHLDHCIEAEEKRLMNTRLHMLPLATKYNDYEGYGRVLFLLLSRVRKKNNVFRRIGAIEVFVYKNEKQTQVSDFHDFWKQDVARIVGEWKKTDRESFTVL